MSTAMCPIILPFVFHIPGAKHSSIACGQYLPSQCNVLSRTAFLTRFLKSICAHHLGASKGGGGWQLRGFLTPISLQRNGTIFQNKNNEFQKIPFFFSLFFLFCFIQKNHQPCHFTITCKLRILHREVGWC